MTSKLALCVQCKTEVKIVLHKQIFENGTEHYVWVCSICTRKNPRGDRQLFIPKLIVEKALSVAEIEAIPILMEAPVYRCVKCGKRGAELHHWAPKGIFGREEADKWPRDYLCKPCHDKWHLLVTPQLVMEKGEYGPQ